MVYGLPNIKLSSGICQGCMIGKHLEHKFEKGKSWRASLPLELIQSNIFVPIPTPSLSNVRYVLTFIDNY